MEARAPTPSKSTARRDLARTIADAIAGVPDRELRGASVLRMLVERLADHVLPTSDPLAKARLRGAIAMRELLNADGGALTASETAELLGISRQAVDKRRKAMQLLAVELPRRGLLYPAWQLTAQGVLPGVVDVLAELGDHDAWSRARFFVTGNDRLGGARPLDFLLRGKKLEPVLRAARSFGEHGAA
jgi:hypothetical protein